MHHALNQFDQIACVVWTGSRRFDRPFSLSVEALAQNPTAKGKEVAKTDGSNQKTKVFRLARTDPEEVKEVMGNLLDFIPVPPMPQGPMNLMGGAGIGGGFGGMMGGGPSAFSIAHDPRTKSIVVRGTEKHLQMAADLVTVVDGPQGKEPPEVKSLRAVALKHAKPEELAAVIESLELEAKLVPLTAAKMVVFTGSDQVMKDIAELIKELDVAADPEPKKVEKKKLLADPPEAK
jgi:hypothetical protein